MSAIPLSAYVEIAATDAFIPSGERIATSSSANDFCSFSTPLRVQVDKERFEFVGDGKWRMFVEVKSDRHQAMKPFTVEAQGSDGQWTVYHEPAEVYGAGRNLELAREDFRAAVLDLVSLLGSLSPEQLGPVPARQLQILRQHLTFA